MYMMHILRSELARLQDQYTAKLAEVVSEGWPPHGTKPIPPSAYLTGRSLGCKETGNALVKKGVFFDAALEYTLAIAFDNSSALLFANRAFCWNSLKRYIAIAPV